ncbi:MAG TPA: FAD-dependent oxidoreductase [Kofleriaceae bacterium]|nr:FAD-dependent oxidoreductase [Kofleriaceae bacterium]
MTARGSHDVVVAGNGVLGHAVARALVQRDGALRVAVVGRRECPAGATGAAGAMLGCFGEVTGPLLSSAAGRAKHALSVAAAPLWDAWIAALNDLLADLDRVQVGRGTIVINNMKSGEIEDESYRAIRRSLEAHDEPFEDLDPSAIDRLHPAGDSRPARAMFLPREGFVDASRLMAGFTAACERSPQISLVDDEVRTAIVEGETVTGVRLASGAELACGQLVLAAGTGTQSILDELPDLARRIPRLFSGVGTSVVFETMRPAFAHVVRTPNRAFACGLHAVPRGEFDLYIGATNTVALRPVTRVVVADMVFLLDCALDQLDQNLQSARLEKWQIGNRPISIDTCPLIGPTSLAGLWILSGTYRDGLFLSPLLGQHMAQRVLGQPGLIEEYFTPERRPLPTLSAAQARVEAARHYEAVGVEHGMRLPRIGWHNDFKTAHAAMIERLYDALDPEYVLPPEFLGIVDNDPTKMIPFFRNYYDGIRRAWS